MLQVQVRSFCMCNIGVVFRGGLDAQLIFAHYSDTTVDGVDFPRCGRRVRSAEPVHGAGTVKRTRRLPGSVDLPKGYKSSLTEWSPRSIFSLRCS